MSTLPHVSASQISTYRLCPRKWWFRYHRPDIKEPSTPEQELGTKIHDAVEHFYKTGERKHVDHEVADESIGEYLKRVGNGLPPMSPGDLDNIRVEYPADYGLGIQLAGVSVKGRIDLLWAPTVDLLDIYDHKSVGNWQYAKTPEQLERDTQLTIYGAWAFQKFPSLEYVRYHHGQIGTKKVRAEIVSTEPLDHDHVFGVLPSIERTVAEMRDLYPVTDVAQVPTDTSACSAFGRACPYAEICPRSIFAGITANHVVPKEGEVKMGLKEKLAARAAAAAGASAPSVAPVTPTPAEPKSEDLAAELGLVRVASPAEVMAGIAPKDAQPPAAETKKPRGPRARGINPPDAAPVDTSKAGSYQPPAETSNATPPPEAGAQTGTLVTLTLNLELNGRRYVVSLPATEVL